MNWTESLKKKFRLLCFANVKSVKQTADGYDIILNEGSIGVYDSLVKEFMDEVREDVGIADYYVSMKAGGLTYHFITEKYGSKLVQLDQGLLRHLQEACKTELYIMKEVEFADKELEKLNNGDYNDMLFEPDENGIEGDMFELPGLIDEVTVDEEQGASDDKESGLVKEKEGDEEKTERILFSDRSEKKAEERKKSR